MNRRAFFDAVRGPLFGGRLAASQVQGVEAILDEWQRRSESDTRWLAYMLATTFHETARTMQPIREYGSAAYFRRMYDIDGDRPGVARSLGNTMPGDGARFCGRGFVQLTGRANYRRISERTGYDLVAEPDLALRPDVATTILFEGMIEGLFTGKSLADFFRAEPDWIGARRIVNGTDRAEMIAGYGVQFGQALAAAHAEADGLASPAPDTGAEPKSDSPGLWNWLEFFLRAILTGGRA